MTTSVLASVGTPLTLKFTGISADVLTVNGAALEVTVPVVTVNCAGPVANAGTTAVICPSLQLVTVAGRVVEPAVKLIVPGVAPKPAPPIVIVAPGFATRGVTLPMDGARLWLESQIETLL
jgi:hypothetical protein